MHFEQKKRCRISQLLLWPTDFKNMKIHKQKQCTEQGNKNNNFPFGQFYYRKFVWLSKHDIKFPTQIWKDFFSDKELKFTNEDIVFKLNLSICNPTNTWDSLPFPFAQENWAQKATQSTDLNFKKNWGGVWAWMNLWGRRSGRSKLWHAIDPI